MVPNTRALELVETLAEQLLLLESDDRAGLDLLRSGFDDLRLALPEADDCDADVRQMLDAAIAMLDKIIARDPAIDADEVLQAIGEMLKVFQPVFRDKATLRCGNELLLFFGMNSKSTFQLPSGIDPQMFADYLSAQPTNLDDFEGYLVRIERDSNPEDISAFRRLIHTMKGESGLLGIEGIEQLCHVMEDNLRAGVFPEELYDDFYKALDWLRATFTAIGRKEPYEEAEPLIHKFVNFSGRDSLAALEKSKKITGSLIPEPSASPEPVEVAAEPLPPSDDKKNNDKSDAFAILETLSAADALQAPAAPLNSENSEKNELPAPARQAAETRNLPVLMKSKSAKTSANSGSRESKKSPPSSVNLPSPAAAAKSVASEKAEVMVLPENVDYEVFAAFVAGQTSNMEDFERILLRLERDGSSDADINALRGLLHTLKGDSSLMGLDEIEKLCHVMEDSLEKGFQQSGSDAFFAALDWLRGAFLALSTKQPINSPRSLIERFERAADKLPSPVSAAGALEELAEKKITTEKPVILNAPKPRQRPPASVYPRPMPKIPSPVSAPPPVKKETPPLPKIPSPVSAPPPVKKEIPPPENTSAVVREMVRVDADRLDRLLDTIGELVISESMVAQSVHRALSENHAVLVRQIGELGKITRTLQEAGMSLRMMAVRSVFNKMDRLVRDLSHKGGKSVRLITKGEETELDKSLIERISDLLVHMVRNSMDHGIENTAAERESLGKPAVGTVTLHAYHKGGNVCLDVSDDGRGLDREAILAKALEKGLLTGDTGAISDSDVFKMIFEPGLSTAKKVTDISGRGVGMDVVKRNIDSMRGRIEISSTPNKGTMFSIRLPLTLAIIDGMVVRVAKERYIIPTLSILHSVQLQKKDVVLVVGKGEMIRDEDMELPMFRLSSLLSTRDAIEDIGMGIVLIVEADGRRIGILCDEILEQQQIVIKSLGDYLAIPGLAGGAIMPDGMVGLIIDIGGLLDIVNKQHA